MYLWAQAPMAAAPFTLFLFLLPSHNLGVAVDWTAQRLASPSLVRPASAIVWPAGNAAAFSRAGGSQRFACSRLLSFLLRRPAPASCWWAHCGHGRRINGPRRTAQLGRHPRIRPRIGKDGTLGRGVVTRPVCCRHPLAAPGVLRRASAGPGSSECNGGASGGSFANGGASRPLPHPAACC